MAVTLEQVEKLREKADVSYEEARQVLEQAGGNLLEALILLERQSRIKTGGGAYYSTCPGGAGEGGGIPRDEPNPRSAALVRVTPGGAGSGAKEDRSSSLWTPLKELLKTAVELLRHSTVNQFEIWRQGELMTSMPILILILLLVTAFWISVPLLVIGLFWGCKYRFSGPDLGRNKVGETANYVADTIHSVVDQVKDEINTAWGKKER